MRTIEVVTPRPEWPAMYRQEAARLHAAIADLLPTLHHIGSTSVPGLAAKPVIDILIEVDDVASLDAYDDAFEALGYRVRGEYGIPGRRLFQKGAVNPTHNVHAFARGHADAVRHLAFRDYLIAHPEVAREYGALKKRVAAACNNDIQRYCDGKDAFVKEHERRAVAWWEASER